MYRSINSFIIAASAILLLANCESSTIKEEVGAYCDCIHGHPDYKDASCMEMIDEITTKYEYDPEALVEIEEELNECNSN